MNFSLLCRTFVGFITGAGLQVHLDSGETRAIVSTWERSATFIMLGGSFVWERARLCTCVLRSSRCQAL